MKIVTNGPRKDSVREETRSASITIETKRTRETKKIPFDTRKVTEKEIRKGKGPMVSPFDTRKVTEKEIRKGKGPMVSGQLESLTSRYATTVKRSNAKRNAKCDCWHPAECPHDKSQSGCKCSTQAKPVTTNIVLQPLL